MEVFIRNIDFQTSEYELKKTLAGILHAEPFTRMSALPINFDVRLLLDDRRRSRGQGVLTLPTKAIGRRLLYEFGERKDGTPRSCSSRGRIIAFGRSKQEPAAELVEVLKQSPYQDPKALEDLNQRTAHLQDNHVAVRTVQFGWMEYDYSSFSAEWEEHFSGENAYLLFDNQRRELRVKMKHSATPGTLSVIVMRFSSIRTVFAPTPQPSHRPALTIILAVPPIFESEPEDPSQGGARLRLSQLPFGNHARVVAVTSHTLRLRLSSSQDALSNFRELARVADLHHIDDIDIPASKSDAYSTDILQRVGSWQRSLPWCIAFQIYSLLYSSHYTTFTGVVYFRGRLAAWIHYEADDDLMSVDECFARAARDFEEKQLNDDIYPADASIFQSLHLIVTPTRMIFQGPFPERSNRIIRSYDAKHHDSFLRVSFTDEDKLHYRFDRDVDGSSMVRSRIERFLKNGICLAGHKFDFLAYSQSALKEHTVYFVKPFWAGLWEVNAAKIIAGIGNFEGSEDRFCPARYAARLSQAFTATDASVVVEAEEVFPVNDISTPDGAYHFTDGVGTLSKGMASETWAELQRWKKRSKKSKNVPSAFQIRFMGSKGMLSVDHALHGREVCLRHSMIKFESSSDTLEIARAFDRPGRYYLNRPLIMVLEGLGVPYESFLRHQEAAVQNVHSSSESLPRCAKMLESFGLGTAFRVPSLLLNLEKLCNVKNLDANVFYRQMLELATHHVLRELKNRARIPIPGAYTLVGVADVHKYLGPGEIFVCIRPSDSNEVTYLEGDVVISRSPTIHPGDVQVVRAIGRPKAGSPFAKEPLANTVVFSVRGTRPLPTMLGGGDLDGDEYNLIPLNSHPEFRPARTVESASYAPAPRKTLTRAADMRDVADFVIDFINYDVLGIVAINWLIIADQSNKSIFDENCLTLSQLHSDAVDFQKSGQPVALDRIPALHFRAKPDWNAPETVKANSARYYKSQRAIGRLARAITLPSLKDADPRSTIPALSDEYKDPRSHRGEDIAHWFAGISIEDHDDPVVRGLCALVGDEYDKVSHEQKVWTEQLFQRYASELRGICSANALLQSRTAMLSEEEAVVGTIAQQTSQPRKRKDHITKLREQTDLLVKGIRAKLAGGEDDMAEDELRRAWHAWMLAYHKRKAGIFGAHSFGWVALGSIFETLKEIEESA
ncbi:RdRP-domain-containing protein [Schizophyllum commune Loenen D]|nr:RdRP-domain-containing protein [Schizophyllum commune Loenen D]